MDRETRKSVPLYFDRGLNGPSSGATYSTVFANTRSGTSNPRFREQIKMQVNASTGYTRSSCEMVSEQAACGMEWDRKNGGNVEHCFTHLRGSMGAVNSLGVPPLGYTTGDVTRAAATADSRLHDRVRETTTEMQGFVLLGELRETLRMFKRPLEGTRKIMDNYARAMKRRAVDSRTKRQFLNGLTDQYLEMVFGWRPVISDAYSIATTAARIVAERRPLTRLVSSFSGAPQSSIHQARVGPGDCLARQTSVTVGEMSVQSIAYLKDSVSGPAQGFQRILDLSGFNLENFVPSIYELIPFSFVADYVSNLGDVISAATTCQRNVIGYVRTTREVITRKETFSFDLAASAANVGGFNHRQVGSSAGYEEYKRVNFTRAAGGAGSIPVPDLHLEVPGVAQATNMAALVIGYFSGINPPRR
jgi:hypothetical protein